MLARGYLWTDLTREIVDLFASMTVDSTAFMKEVPYWLMHGWFIEKPNRGIRPKGKQKTTTESVRELRDRRRAAGECIDCGRIRHPKSKSYCAKHREADRKRAEAKRAKRMTSTRPLAASGGAT